MKKFIVPFMAVLAGLAMASCGKINVNTDVRKDVEVDVKETVTPATDYLVGEYTAEEAELEVVDGVVTVASPDVEPVEVTATESQLEQGIDLPIVRVKVPISSKFPKDDIFAALERPHLVLKVTKEAGKAFNYASTITNKSGKTFEIKASIPAEAEEVLVYVSEGGDAAPVIDNGHVNAEAVKDFPQIFEQSPAEIEVTSAKIFHTAKSAAPADAAPLSLTFSMKSVFPFVIKKDKSFTIQKSFDLSKVDFSGFFAVTGLEATILLTHSLPLTFELSLVEPQEVSVQCPKILAAKNGKETTQELDIKASCPTGVVAFQKAVVNVKATLTEAQTYQISEDVNIKLDVKKDEEGKQMVTITGKLSK